MVRAKATRVFKENVRLALRHLTEDNDVFGVLRVPSVLDPLARGVW